MGDKEGTPCYTILVCEWRLTLNLDINNQNWIFCFPASGTCSFLLVSIVMITSGKEIHLYLAEHLESIIYNCLSCVASIEINGISSHSGPSLCSLSVSLRRICGKSRISLWIEKQCWKTFRCIGNNFYLKHSSEWYLN